jgi:hypothetical protein
MNRRGMPSLVALLGLLAVAGYQNREKNLPSYFAIEAALLASLIRKMAVWADFWVAPVPAAY